MNNIKLAIYMFLIKKMDEIVKNGIEIYQIIEDKGKHPHYTSAEAYEIYFDGNEIIEDTALSGSPSCWNHYETPIESWEDVIEFIIQKYIETEEDFDDNIEVKWNRELEEILKEIKR